MKTIARRIPLVIACAAEMALAASMGAQDPGRSAPTTASTAASHRYRYRLVGVYDEDSGEPISGVEVKDVLSGLSMATTASGTVSLVFLPDGGSLVRLRKIGYELQTLMIVISPADTAPVTLTLRRAIQLPAVTVSATAPRYLSSRLNDAEHRLLSHAGGHFIDEKTMRRWDHATLTDAIISNMPGLHQTVGPHGESYMLSSRNMCALALSCTHADCYVSVYVDGVRYSSATPVDFERLEAQDYAIAEYYAGGASTPVQFGGSACGVLLLWSRER